MPTITLSDGRRIRFQEAGVGATVVLLHGLGLSGASWRPLLPLLAERYRVIAPDLTGHGGSDRPAGPFTIEGLADDVAELLRARDADPVAAVGLSMGGMVALALAQRHTGLVSAVVAINSITRTPEEYAAALTDRADRTRAGGMTAVVDETITRWFTPEFSDHHPATVAETRDQFLAADPDVHADAWQALIGLDLEGGLAALKQPVLAITGSRDLSVPPEIGARLADLAGDGHHEHLDGASHMSPIEQPAILADTILKFLDGRH
ncbi:MAG TPA: alpha/beta fold hydrolase [Acidimicrobiia bacterium]|nr:alpha/beta fold hydrolase [Acidimicrobiia bacterium]